MHWQMGNRNYPSYNYNYLEAVAIFFTNAFNAWNNTVYKEVFTSDNNLEFTPYLITDTIVNGVRGSLERGSNILRPWLCGRYASFLWNLYDSKDEGVFTSDEQICWWPVYYTSDGERDMIRESEEGFHHFATRGYNNEDLEYGRFVFEWLDAQPGLPQFADFKYYVLSQEPNTHKQNSINRLYDNLVFSEDYPEIRPNPVSINGVSVVKIGNDNNLQVISGSYSDTMAVHSQTVVWNDTLTFVHTWDLRNLEEGYRVKDAQNSIVRGVIPYQDSITYYRIALLDLTNYNSPQFIHSQKYLSDQASICSIDNIVHIPSYKSVSESSETNENSYIYQDRYSNETKLFINSNGYKYCSVKIYSPAGQLVSDNILSLNIGFSEYPLDLTEYSNGSYLVSLTYFNSLEDSKTETIKFIK